MQKTKEKKPKSFKQSKCCLWRALYANVFIECTAILIDSLNIHVNDNVLMINQNKHVNFEIVQVGNDQEKAQSERNSNKKVN